MTQDERLARATEQVEHYRRQAEFFAAVLLVVIPILLIMADLGRTAARLYAEAHIY
jgi:hypothetical protein